MAPKPSGFPAAAFALPQAVGLALIIAAWLAARDDVRVAEQLPSVVLGVVGLTVAAAGNAAGLVAQRRRLQERRRRLEPSEIRIPVSPRDPAAVPVAGATMTRYHRPDCPFVAGKAVQASDTSAQRQAGRRPCAVCNP